LKKYLIDKTQRNPKYTLLLNALAQLIQPLFTFALFIRIAGSYSYRHEMVSYALFLLPLYIGGRG